MNERAKCEINKINSDMDSLMGMEISRWVGEVHKIREHVKSKRACHMIPGRRAWYSLIGLNGRVRLGVRSFANV
jgi:hypothetical protein